ncbi:MAG: phytase, partial [Acidimicrobiia bacterium]
ERALDVFDLTGKRLQRLEAETANNVDLRDGFSLAGATVPVLATAGSGSVSVLTLDPATRRLETVTKGGSLAISGAHGICLHHSPQGRFYAFAVSRGGASDPGYVVQLALTADGDKVALGEVRTIAVATDPPGANSNDRIEGCVVDDELGHLFVAEQDRRIWRYTLDPETDAPVGEAVVVDTTDGDGHLSADVEGLALVTTPGGGGFLIASSQGDDSFTVYERAAPHRFVRHVDVRDGERADGCDRSDGVEAVAADLGPAFPRGVFICQDNANGAPAPGNQNLKLVPLEQVVPLGAPAPPPSPGPAPDPEPQPQPPASGGDPPAASPPERSGYWMLGTTGRIFDFGDASHHGEVTRAGLGAARAVDLEPTPSGNGYLVADSAGRIHDYGDAAASSAAVPLAPGEEVTSLAAITRHAGWRFTNLGRAIPFGGAPHLGDMSGVRLNGPVLDSVATPSGRGYYMVAADGGIFTFGDARFAGSMGGIPLNAPVQSLVPDPDDGGYWLVASDGGVFSFAAEFRGSMGGVALNAPVTGMVASGGGYLMVAADGGIFNFSDRPFHGSLGANPPADPITAVAAVP